MKTKAVFLRFFMMMLCTACVYSQSVYDDFYRFKAQLYNIDGEKVDSALEAYKTKTAQLSLSEEERIALDNFITLEELNFLKKDGKADKKNVYRMLKHRDEVCAAFMAGKKNTRAGKWFLLSMADVKSRLSEFLSEAELYNEAYITKELYTDALKKDKKFSPAHLSFGLWLFFAPPVAGGGYDKSLAEFSKAVSNAKNEYEKYLALVFRSQVHFALEDQKSAAADLEKATKLISGENFTAVVKGLNDDGKIFFE